VQVVTTFSLHTRDAEAFFLHDELTPQDLRIRLSEVFVGCDKRRGRRSPTVNGTTPPRARADQFGGMDVLAASKRFIRLTVGAGAVRAPATAPFTRGCRISRRRWRNPQRGRLARGRPLGHRPSQRGRHAGPWTDRQRTAVVADLCDSHTRLRKCRLSTALPVVRGIAAMSGRVAGASLRRDLLSSSRRPKLVDRGQGGLVDEVRVGLWGVGDGSLASPASPTTSKPPFASTLARPSRTMAASSAITTRVGTVRSSRAHVGRGLREIPELAWTRGGR
jgi:hypothetical protein